jgi:putative ABC transport system ATP-binding protein
MEPQVLLADEPTGNLDRKSSDQVLEVLQTMNRSGLTLVVVTHDPRVARRASRVVFLVDGEIVRSVAGRELPAGGLAEVFGVGGEA